MGMMITITVTMAHTFEVEAPDGLTGQDDALHDFIAAEAGKVMDSGSPEWVMTYAEDEDGAEVDSW